MKLELALVVILLDLRKTPRLSLGRVFRTGFLREPESCFKERLALGSQRKATLAAAGVSLGVSLTPCKTYAGLSLTSHSHTHGADSRP